MKSVLLITLLSLTLLSCGKKNQDNQHSNTTHSKFFTYDSIEFVDVKNTLIQSLEIKDFTLNLNSNSEFYLEHNYQEKYVPHSPISLKDNYLIESNQSIELMNYAEITSRYDQQWLFNSINQEKKIHTRISFWIKPTLNSNISILNLTFILKLNHMPLMKIDLDWNDLNQYKYIELEIDDLIVKDFFRQDNPEFNLQLVHTHTNFIQINQNQINDTSYSLIHSDKIYVISHQPQDTLKNILSRVDPNLQIDFKNQILRLFDVFSKPHLEQLAWTEYFENSQRFVTLRPKQIYPPKQFIKMNQQKFESSPFEVILESDLELLITANNEKYILTKNELPPAQVPPPQDMGWSAGYGDRFKARQSCHFLRHTISSSTEKNNQIELDELNSLSLCSEGSCHLIHLKDAISTQTHLRVTLKNLHKGTYYFKWDINPIAKQYVLGDVPQAPCSPGQSLNRHPEYKTQTLNISMEWKNFVK
jgi:hypothetical protein